MGKDADGDIDMEDLFAKFQEEGGENQFAKDVLANIETDDGEECALCLDIMDEPVLLPKCSHQL